MSLKLEEQVPSLELCKKLKSLSYPQEGLFYWQIETSDSEFLKRYKIERFKDILITDSEKRTSDRYWKGKKLKLSYEHFVAPTVAEMGERLPYQLFVGSPSKHDSYHLEIFMNSDKEFSYSYYDDSTSEILHDTENCKTEANARAKMLIWLVENKHLSFKGERDL